MPQSALLRYWRYSHGTTWAELCDDLTVVDVAGDHFSLLRQDPPDMEPLVRLVCMRICVAFVHVFV